MVTLMRELGLERGSILDYGSGVGTFGNAVRQLYGKRYDVTNYEPTLPQWCELASGPFDAVICTHVLEHVEEECLADTLNEIRARALHVVFLEIPFGPAKEVLADGRNAHILQRPHEWWMHQLDTCFDHACITMKLSTLKSQAQFTLHI